MPVGEPANELEWLRDDLRQVREELARLREEQEQYAEHLYRERRRRKAAEKRLDALATRVAQALNREPSSKGRGGLAARLPGRRTPEPVDPKTMELVRLLRRSGLFQGPWYVSRYPEVVTSGMSPALHYLTVGAAEGFDPGPKFQTSAYLARHPEVAESGVNPLVHKLQQASDDATSGGKGRAGR